MKKYFEIFKSKMQALESSKILLLLSGGVDSMVLAHFLIEAKDELNLKIGCFHLNHLYRGIDADNDEKFVRNFCLQNNLEHHIEKRNVEKIATEKKQGFELCARELRLEIAENIKEKYNYDYILTAHHLDDSTESIVHNFIRGFGLSGLKGIDYKKGYFIRPFLDFEKSELIEIARNLNIEYREDKSNLDTDFTRNQIRHNIIPEILKINPKFKKTLNNSIKQIAEDNSFIEKTAIKTLGEIKNPKDDLNFNNMDIISLDIEKFRNIDIAIKKRIIRIIVEKFKGNLVDVYSSIIDEIIALSNNKTSGKYLTFKDIVFEVSRDKFIIYKNIDDEFEKINIKIGENNFNGAIINVSMIDINTLKNYEFENNKKQNDYIILPNEYLDKTLVLRRRKSGDYITPSRLKGQKKSVKKLFIDLKLSRLEKSRQVLLSTDDRNNENVLWIAGKEKIDTKLKINNKNYENFILIELLNL